MIEDIRILKRKIPIGKKGIFGGREFRYENVIQKKIDGKWIDAKWVDEENHG